LKGAGAAERSDDRSGGDAEGDHDERRYSSENGGEEVHGDGPFKKAGSEGSDQTIMPGRTLVAIRMVEQIVARAVARMFMMMAFRWKRVGMGCGSDDRAGDDADGDEEAGADDGEGGGEQLALGGGEDGHGVGPFMFLSVPTGLAGDARYIARVVPVWKRTVLQGVGFKSAQSQDEQMLTVREISH
jgi:hypothetical protein